MGFAASSASTRCASAARSTGGLSAHDDAMSGGRYGFVLLNGVLRGVQCGLPDEQCASEPAVLRVISTAVRNDGCVSWCETQSGVNSDAWLLAVYGALFAWRAGLCDAPNAFSTGAFSETLSGVRSFEPLHAHDDVRSDELHDALFCGRSEAPSDVCSLNVCFVSYDVSTRSGYGVIVALWRDALTGVLLPVLQSE